MNILSVFREIKKLADKYRIELNEKIDRRIIEMKTDNKDHYLIYNVLGITSSEGNDIDLYQNKGRFLYKYAGSFLEEATIICFKAKFPDSKKIKIDNTASKRPKTFEIDCLINDKYAVEIKWRDATTDGDHITKEHTRIKEIAKGGYKPIRVMFYYPNREQAIRIQSTLETLYKGVNGRYYHNNKAWKIIKKTTSIDLYRILCIIADYNKRKLENGY